jgi:peptidoglycan hydrolase CwlO-like protein
MEPTPIVGIVKEWIGVVLLIISILVSGGTWLKSRKMDKYTVNKEKYAAKGEELSYTEKLENTLEGMRNDITKVQDNQKKTDHNIIVLKCQIRNYQALISAMTGQLQAANIIPVKMEDVKVADCEELIET